MKRFALLLSTFIACGFMCKCQSRCNVKGHWLLKTTLMFENYEQASPYSKNMMTFLKDSIELESGFFYLTDDLVDNFPIGRDPFVYYGKKESYKIIGDSLYIHNSPYKSWRPYRIHCDGGEELYLIGKKDSLILRRVNSMNRNESNLCSIKKIKAYVDGGNSDIFKVKYKVTYSDYDMLIFEEWDSLKNKFNARDFKLKPGTFKSICQGFGNVDLLKLKKFYPSEISESVVTFIEITLDNAKVIKFELRNQDYPDELRFALIPILYSHQQLLYSHLPPVR